MAIPNHSQQSMWSDYSVLFYLAGKCFSESSVLSDLWGTYISSVSSVLPDLMGTFYLESNVLPDLMGIFSLKTRVLSDLAGT